MSWLRKWMDKIPGRWRSWLQQYGAWVLLAAGIGLAWAANSKQDLVSFDKFTALKPAKDLAISLGYVLGYTIAGLYKFPHRQISMFIVVWALTLLHYRYLFVRFAVNTSWRSKLVYVALVLVVRWILVVGITAWLGFDRLSGSLVNLCLLIALLYAFISYFRQLRRVRRQLTEQKTRAELDALKAQINPHFLFNSLNNIFGTALTENGPRTADSVQQLARILRYMLEQADTDRASVDTELQFLTEYVLLQKQQLPTETTSDVQFSYEWDEQPAVVAPLLLSPLLDYAFRRSMSVSENETGTGFLHAKARVQTRHLQFVLDYNYPDGPTDSGDELQNVRQRLALIYPNRHQFSVQEENTTAHLELTINLN